MDKKDIKPATSLPMDTVGIVPATSLPMDTAGIKPATSLPMDTVGIEPTTLMACKMCHQLPGTKIDFSNWIREESRYECYACGEMRALYERCIFNEQELSVDLIEFV